MSGLEWVEGGGTKSGLAKCSLHKRPLLLGMGVSSLWAGSEVIARLERLTSLLSLSRFITVKTTEDILLLGIRLERFEGSGLHTWDEAVSTEISLHHLPSVPSEPKFLISSWGCIFQQLSLPSHNCAVFWDVLEELNELEFPFSVSKTHLLHLVTKIVLIV